MRVAKVRHPGWTKPSFLAELALVVVSCTLARYPPARSHALWVAFAMFVTAGVLLFLPTIAMSHRSELRARRQKKRFGAYVLKGSAADWLRIDGEFAVIGGPGYRARLRFSDIQGAHLSRYEATIRGFIRDVPGVGGAVDWRLSTTLRSRQYDPHEAERFKRDFRAWRAACSSTRSSVMPPVGYPAWFMTRVMASFVLVAAFLVPLPGLEWSAPGVSLVMLPIFGLELRPTRKVLRKAGHSFDDERATGPAIHEAGTASKA